MRKKTMCLLYSRLKVFYFKEKLDSLPASRTEILPPVHIRIKPTNVCTHDCWYCAYKSSNMQLGQDMIKTDFIPERKMMEIIDDIITMGVKAVTFSGGGDPFCYQHLLAAVKKLAASLVSFAALTNGSRLQGEIADIFARHATWLRISIDGWDDESYSRYRRVPKGEFTKVLGNMERFKKLKGKCRLGVSLIVDKDNASHIYEFIKVVKNLGVDSAKVSPCITDNDAAKNNLYHRSIFRRVKEEVERAKSDFEGGSFEIHDAYHELDEKFAKDYSWCPYLQILPIIGADLNIYPCQDKAYNLADALIGSIKDVSFREFWFSDKSKFFKINPSAQCNHHCVANAKNKMVLEYLNLSKDHIGFV